MIDKDTALVVPSIREHSLKMFIEKWDAIGLFDHVDLFVIEDNPKMTFSAITAHRHWSWKEIELELGDDAWVIPRRSDTVRSFGYYMAWKSDHYDYIMTLDDDCYPPTTEDGLVYQSGRDFVDYHKSQLTSKSKWFNTLNDVKPRGIPYYNVGKRTDVIVNHGLWTNVLDYDAPTQLANPKKENFSFDNRIVPYGSYFPMCGMNVMWDAKYTSWMYHLLMGQRAKYSWLPESHGIDDPVRHREIVKLPFDRFGDIWCGVFMKRLADIYGKSVSTGMPYIRHERASNPFTNLKKEVNGIEVNEKLWEYVDKFSHDSYSWPDGIDPNDLYAELGDHIVEYKEFAEYIDYFMLLGKAMKTWAKLFDKKNKNGK